MRPSRMSGVEGEPLRETPRRYPGLDRHRFRRAGQTVLVALLLAAGVPGPLTAQQRGQEEAEDPSALLVGVGLGAGVGGILVGLAGDHSMVADAVAFAGVRVTPEWAVLAEAGILPTPLQDPLSDRELTAWRVMVGVQGQAGGWVRPSVGWVQGSWSGEAGSGSDGGPAIGLALGGLPWDLAGRWRLGVEGFARWGWIGPERSIHTRTFGVRGLLMRR